MIIRVTAWTMLDGGAVIEAAVSALTDLGTDAEPKVWRTFRGPVPGEVLNGPPADGLAWLAETLLDLAYDRS